MTVQEAAERRRHAEDTIKQILIRLAADTGLQPTCVTLRQSHVVGLTDPVLTGVSIDLRLP